MHPLSANFWGNFEHNLFYPKSKYLVFSLEFASKNIKKSFPWLGNDNDFSYWNSLYMLLYSPSGKTFLNHFIKRILVCIADMYSIYNSSALLLKISIRNISISRLLKYAINIIKKTLFQYAVQILFRMYLCIWGQWFFHIVSSTT